MKEQFEVESLLQNNDNNRAIASGRGGWGDAAPLDLFRQMNQACGWICFL